jgi:hypothetical protein
MINLIDYANYTIESDLEFILQMLGEIHEQVFFGSRQELIDELRKMEELPSFDHVGFFAEIISSNEAEFQKADPKECIRKSIPLRNSASGRTLIAISTTEYAGRAIQVSVMFAVLAHCAEARRPDCEREKQWWHLASARTYLGYLRGTIAGREVGVRTAARVRATRGATARHKENRGMKNDAFDWLSKNMERFRSKDAAAKAISGDVVPVEFRTARNWIDQWEKTRASE